MAALEVVTPSAACGARTPGGEREQCLVDEESRRGSRVHGHHREDGELGQRAPEESAEIAGKTTGYPVEQTTNWHYAANALLDKESLNLWWKLVQDIGEVTPTWNQVKIEDMATNAHNPYAKTADLLDSQKQNTAIITDTQNTGVLNSPLVQR